MIDEKLKYKKYKVDNKQKKQTVQIIENALIQDELVIFAYLYGSFVESDAFSDIDISVYLRCQDDKLAISYELKLEESIANLLQYPIDIRVLNIAPLSFCYSVIKDGIRLLDKDEDTRVEFETITIKKYFDFLPFRQRYFEEAFEL